MKYSLRIEKPHEQLIHISISCPVSPGRQHFKLPAWRPGRYETQNFARFILDESAEMDDGTSLQVEKTSIHNWMVETSTKGTLIFSYKMYANMTDAGGTYLDEDRLLVNGINLFMYKEDLMDSPCELSLELPSNWMLGGGFMEEGRQQSFSDYHQLVDTPFLAGKELFHHEFPVMEIPTHIWFQGDCHPDFNKLEQDIRAYSEAQIQMFGDFPVDQYHYLFVSWPFAYRHGVEHFNSTVIAMGPGHRLMQGRYYESLLEISSHELFHTWNVKYIRPTDMAPYDYSQPNYSKLHYITEGVTTYYGDLMLWKGGVWNENRWLKSINGEIQSHYLTGAMDHISLEEASIQSWTNGYKGEAVPNRKISFYTKGYLVAMLLDYTIRKSSMDAHSLDDVMKQMYISIGKEGKSYSKEDFKGITEHYAGVSLDKFWSKYISGTESLAPALQEMGRYMGITLLEVSPVDPVWNWWGMQVKKEDNQWIVDRLYEDSPARHAGLHIGDEIIAIGGRKLGNDLSEWLTYLEGSFRTEVHYFHKGKIKTAQLPLSSEGRYKVPQFVLIGNPSEEQRQHMQSWKSVKAGSKLNLG
ncbi:MAG: PDZ domain-containing protein [Bacteroidia bacterium]|nr:PDZ domain-containing protein [Bacteroidia bacterium]